MKKPFKKPKEEKPYKRANDDEIRERLSILIKLKARKPTLTKQDLMQIAVDKWGLQQRAGYDYIEKIDAILVALSDADIKRERGLMLQQLDDLYETTFDKRQFNIALGALKKRAEILNLDSFNINIAGEVTLKQQLDSLSEEQFKKITEQWKNALSN